MFVADSMEFMSSAGRRRMLEQPWLLDRESLDREQKVVRTMLATVSDNGNTHSLNVLRHQLMQLHDIRTTLHNLETHTLLDEVELFEIKNLAYLCNVSRRALDETGLSDTFSLPDLTGVFSILDPDNTGVPNFYIYDSYDNRLAPLRRQMNAADEARMGELLAEQNEIQQQVIVGLCRQLYPFAQTLASAMDGMAYIDFTHARAVLAREWQLQSPESGDTMFLSGLVNPRLKLHNESEGLRYQPVDIELTHGVTLVTGANMAGKTVLLKSIGLAQLIYQFGFPVPASGCCLEPVDDVVFCIGDEQNEMNGLSSFASEITRISDILSRSEREHLLVLIDEPARTTNPVEGKALVQALVSIMDSRNSFTIITTHYSQLGVACRRLRVKGFVENLVDKPLTAQNINRYIDYSLVPDDSDEVPHEALRIAEMLSCNKGLLSAARDFLKG